MKIIWHWLVVSLALIFTAYVMPGQIVLRPLYVAFFAGAILLFINFIIKPIISLLTLPINLLTLGVFGIVLNGAIFWTLGAVIPGFHIASFMSATIGACIVSVLNWILEKVL